MLCSTNKDGIHRAVGYSIFLRSEVCSCGEMTFMTDKRKMEGFPFSLDKSKK